MTKENKEKLKNYKNNSETEFVIHSDKERDEILKALGVSDGSRERTAFNMLFFVIVLMGLYVFAKMFIL